MFTQCRGCGEVFAVSVDDIVTANAMVRCSSCGAVFNSLQTLSEYKASKNVDLILHESDNPPPLLTHEYKQSVVKQRVIAEPEVTDNTTESLEDDTFFNVRPDFVAEKEPSKSTKISLLWITLTIGALFLLAWQSSNALKNGSLKLPNGIFKETVCAQIECFNKFKKSNFNKIALVSRSIRQHHGRDNALIITTGIINSDENIQAFPAFQVKMSNLDGEIVAMRRFLPKEYIDAETIAVGMLPNTLIPITLELQSPGNNAVTFEVGFSEIFGSRQ